MASAYTGHQEMFKRMARGERFQYGQLHAPAVVNPPDHSKDKRNPQWARDAAANVLDMKQWLKVADGYDPACGMQSKPAWAHEFLMAVWENWMETEVTAWQNAFWDKKAEAWRLLGELGLIDDIGPRGFNNATHIYLASIGVHRLSSKYNNYTVGNMAWHATAIHDFFKRQRYPKEFEAYKLTDFPKQRILSRIPKGDEALFRMLNELGEVLQGNLVRLSPVIDGTTGKPYPGQNKLVKKDDYTKPAPILPQELQSKEEALEAIAMSKVSVPPAKIDEMLEAVQVAVKEWNTNADARILLDGYYLYGHPEGASVPTAIHLKHPSHPNRIIVGQMNYKDWLRWASGDGDNDIILQFASNRGEIREYMHKVAAGSEERNPKLPGVMMQAPIPDSVKTTPQIATIKNAESHQAYSTLFIEDDRPNDGGEPA